MSDLKPCPFCASNEVEIYSNEDFCFARCRNCEARGSWIGLDSTSEAYSFGDIEKEKNDATLAWNKRAKCDE